MFSKNIVKITIGVLVPLAVVTTFGIIQHDGATVTDMVVGKLVNEDKPVVAPVSPAPLALPVVDSIAPEIPVDSGIIPVEPIVPPIVKTLADPLPAPVTVTVVSENHIEKPSQNGGPTDVYCSYNLSDGSVSGEVYVGKIPADNKYKITLECPEFKL